MQDNPLKKENANEPGNLKTHIAAGSCLLLESLSSCVAVEYCGERKKGRKKLHVKILRAFNFKLLHSGRRAVWCEKECKADNLPCLKVDFVW